MGSGPCSRIGSQELDWGGEGIRGGTGLRGLEAPCLGVAPSLPPPSLLSLLLSFFSPFPLAKLPSSFSRPYSPCAPRPLLPAVPSWSSRQPLPSHSRPSLAPSSSPSLAPSEHSHTFPSWDPGIILLRAPLPSRSPSRTQPKRAPKALGPPSRTLGAPAAQGLQLRLWPESGRQMEGDVGCRSAQFHLRST